MGKYIIKRIAASALTLFVVMSITFFLIRAIPGGPFTEEKNIPPEVMQTVMEKYKLNDPLYKQYIDYVSDAVRLNLGPSLKYEGRTVNDIIAESFPISAKIGALAILIALAAGIPLGVLAAIKRGTIWDKITSVFSIVGVTIPNFVIATILIYILVLKLKVISVGVTSSFTDMIPAAVTLAGFPMAYISRIVRSSMLEVIQQDYIRTARAKGMLENKVIFVHALRNALMPVLTYMGPLVAGILTGSFVVEQVFSIPGIGTYFVTSIQDRDYTTIVGVTIFYSFLLITFNLIVDILYAALDSRINLE
ncbi:oligopeptide transport system permease protein OppB [Clostridium pasteurianum DSM 525 = ATCC 6013]|uniref:ABC-type transporter, integral membrane subunit n=1 Tax=Clostridium pasteurianum DSM 525 = ATCC 6013 TaxID=1262449 RepID=A0A0H3J818_CLOPA|nr:ABC transporter permease [Clostridium pasteurianum]AJA47150.1 oligopeptide transport system permease protein OppB [Clostridium pasteurianum DSM 525 = ATCC 6013]AJA51138.1 oligopeptide transport system permease protein OppB [Clostridium pasteurianum DSM 525 = ATCC 6013]AOZ74509.1 peptide ABC transporter permease [Clostridium pasteurianum DSM 525 = ATCC 6013]AOZ78306.1 peptide ABC transporter permease [Clostridium pasteurianum]ELP59463.1 oligopeptide ABC transporter permease OppB [Clostridium